MRRHDLAYLRPDAPFHFHCGATDTALAQRVSAWMQAKRPLVVARQGGNGHELLLGLTLPASEGRRRMGCIVAHQDVLQITQPLSITRCLHHLEAELAAPLAELAARLENQGVQIGVYGSLAWEVLSGERYRHAASDIDVICDVTSLEETEVTLAALGETATRLACGLDGEIRFPDGRAAAWKELRSAWSTTNAQVLVKGPAEVAMVPVASLLAQFEEMPAHA